MLQTSSKNSVFKVLVTSAVLALATTSVQAETKHSHDHSHDHADENEAAKDIYKGYFEDSQIKDRSLADWEGDWQSVYPLLKSGALAPVMAKKAEAGSKTVEQYTAYYDTGYKTDVERITFDGQNAAFFTPDGTLSGEYAYDGFEVLTYKKGNRGVRYIFKQVGGDEAAPDYFQFSDHKIAPAKADHYHLYWGDDRAALLEEVTNWPTYYPRALSAEQIVEEMLAH
ncbi:metal-binding protein ZinT [Lentibacter algarum]|uniref:ZinT family metal-binding protein n=1 Tax=Lentibacter algarum TaxID=576131 RepID=UPI001C09741A|nr:metal-binding protein ZinT [Lentibacter algarum]MBU2983261.1 metal-binding protein ZinT [Lentibacter algarum]